MENPKEILGKVGFEFKWILRVYPFSWILETNESITSVREAAKKFFS